MVCVCNIIIVLIASRKKTVNMQMHRYTCTPKEVKHELSTCKEKTSDWLAACPTSLLVLCKLALVQLFGVETNLTGRGGYRGVRTSLFLYLYLPTPTLICLAPVPCK